MDVKNQKRMAAEVLKCGVHRVYMNPNNIEDISEAVTRQDVKRLVKEGIIRSRQKKGISNARKKYSSGQKLAGKRTGHGSRRGTKYARYPRKRRWIATIRPIRAKLREYREGGYITPETFRHYYRHASGGMFKSVSHLRLHMRSEKAFVKIPKEEVE